MEKIAYKDGKFAPLAETHISPLDRSFLFGDGVYEVIKTLNGKSFLAQEHLDRLKFSLAGLKFPEVDLAHLAATSVELMQRNKLDQGEALIYLEISRGTYDLRTHEFPKVEIKPSLFMMATPCPQINKKGLQVITHDDLRGLLCQYKTVNLLGNVLARQAAAEQGGDEVILVRDGIALECSSSALAIIKDGKVMNHPPAKYILPSLTIIAMKRICEQEGIPHEERPFTVAEVQDADEVLILSTVRDISQATMLDKQPIGGKDPETLDKMQAAFAAMIKEQCG